MTEEQVFLAVLDLPSQESRTAYLDEVCSQDSKLRLQVEELLAAHERSGQFLDQPAAEQMGAGPLAPEGETLAIDIESSADMTDKKKSNPSPSEGESDDLQFLSPSIRPDSLGRLGHYEMLQVLGRGGFGIVFRAFDETLQRVVALKVMAPQIATLSPARKRFLREARSSAQVRHENVVQVYEVDEQPLPYLTMEFIPGETLQQRLDRSGPLDVSEILRIGRQVAEGLAAAHACDLIHRDIKPGNILLEGGSHKAKITDFGLARAADDASISQSGVIAGTPMFMAPEQALGQPIDQRADLFSLGSVLYQMASGRPPFRAPGALAVLKRVAEESPRPIQEIIPETPDWLCGIITKLHAKNPEDRFQSAREVADLLADCEAKLKAKEEVKYTLPGEPSHVSGRVERPSASRGRKWVAAAAILLLPMIALAVTEFAGVTNLFLAPARFEVTFLVDDLNIRVRCSAARENETPEQFAERFREKARLKDFSDFMIANRFDGNRILLPAGTKWWFICEQDDNLLYHKLVTVDRAQEVHLPWKSELAKKLDSKTEPGWVQLFNGKDLTGWKTHPNLPGEWRVDGGTHHLVSSRAPGYLFSEKGDFGDFHLRAEVHIVEGGNSGIFFRTPFKLQPGGQNVSVPSGWYEADIFWGTVAKPGRIKDLGETTENLADPNQWMTLEIIARGNRFITKVNGKVAVDVVDNKSTFSSGHIALQAFTEATSVRFRKIEIKELSPASLPPPFKNTLGMEFVIVPRGKSWLGGGKDKPGDKEVDIPADFYLGKYEVTQEEWEKVMGENPSHFSRTGGGKDAVITSDARLNRFPVENVSWNQCQIFVAKLNQREEEAGWIYRLPTAAEWEYACRGGPMSDRAESAFDFYLANPTNTLLPDQANFGHESGLRRTCKVGSYSPNRLGLFDMHGNVWEWCGDEVEPDPKDPIMLSRRVDRGGGWDYGSEECRALVRSANPQSLRGSALGLRLARVPTGAPSPEAKTPPVAVGPFTDADANRIAALPAAEQVEEVRKELKRLNPKFDGKLEHKIEGDAVTELHVLTDEVVNIAPVRALKRLIYLDCRGTYPNKGKLSDLSPLKGMTFSRLDCSSTQVADLSPLSGVPLTFLHFNHNPVSTLAPLKGMPLVELGCAETKVSDFSPLKGMKLQMLGAQLLAVTDLTPLQGMPLKGLDLYHTLGATNLEPLKGMPLEGLNLQDVPVSDLSPLKGMTTLRTLNLAGDALSDLTPLQGMKLTDLFIREKKVSDLSPLKGMPLARLGIDGTSVTDLRPLQGMELVEIGLTPKNITQGLNILRDMKSLKTIGIDGDKAWPAAEFWDRYAKGEFTK